MLTEWGENSCYWVEAYSKRTAMSFLQETQITYGERTSVKQYYLFSLSDLHYLQTTIGDVPTRCHTKFSAH